jgi:hypothetical protein
MLTLLHDFEFFYLYGFSHLSSIASTVMDDVRPVFVLLDQFLVSVYWVSSGLQS